MKIKVADAPELVIDFLVAKCEGERYGPPTFRVHQNSKGATVYLNAGMQQSGIPYKPSTDWAQGGRLIERENICLNWEPRLKEMEWEGYTAAPEQLSGRVVCYGPTPLIAAMRCLIASKLGDEVDVPEELLCTP